MSTNAIIQQLQAARSDLDGLNAQIADLERRRDIAKAKVEAFELSSKYMADMQPSAEKPKKKSRNRMPSSDWVKIFGELHERYSDGFGYDQIMGVGATLGIDLKRPSLRTKMMNLADAGHVDRIDNGEFKITEKGARYFGLVKKASELPSIPVPSNLTKTPGIGLPGVQNFTDNSAEVELSDSEKLREGLENVRASLPGGFNQGSS